MSAVATATPAPEPQVTAVAGRAHTFSVAAGSRRTTLDLEAALWSPRAFAPVAAAFFPVRPAVSRTTQNSAVRMMLLDMTPGALMNASTAVSAALQKDMGNVAAHDAAALILSAFALREAAERLSDTRWALNRMTAHLAIADALGGSSDSTIDHRLSSAVLLAFTGKQVEALRTLDALDDQGSVPGVAEWSRALRLRIDEDWRTLKDPSRATRMEQREYLRARRATVQGSMGGATLEALRLEPDADLVRVISESSLGVADGWLSELSFEYERGEAEEVYARLHGRPMGDARDAALDVPAPRGVSDGRVQVLPWGAWAEFFQRHLAAAIANHDSFVRLSLGAHERADRDKTSLARDYGHLWSFPLATMFWTRGRAGTEADSTYLSNAVDVVLSSPHRVTSTVWAQIDLGTKYEPVRRGVPPTVSWFVVPEPRSAYQLTSQLAHSGHPRPVKVLEQLRADAPYDWGLATTYLRERYGRKVTVAAAEEAAGHRVDYDLRAIEWEQQLVHDRDAGIVLERRACGIAASWCLVLGEDLASLGREAEGAHAYEIAFADPEVDAVTKSVKSAWLVRYYRSHRRVPEALALAEQGAETASFMGLATAGRLYEDLGRLDDAEAAFIEGAKHYDKWSELTAFYYRQVQVKKNRDYISDWKTSSERLFPDGLTDERPPDTRPAAGVLVEQGSANASFYNLRVGDIIVAVDGWRVANVNQYRAVRAFPVEGRIVLTVWRGTGHLDVIIPNRDFVPLFDVADYPEKGWIE